VLHFPKKISAMMNLEYFFDFFQEQIYPLAERNYGIPIFGIFGFFPESVDRCASLARADEN
jgi:hypothetical protein